MRTRPPRSPRTTDRETAAALAALVATGRSAPAVVVGGTRITIPAPFRAEVARLFDALARDGEVVVSRAAVHVTTQRAADLLGMSRQHVVRLVDAGRLPIAIRKTGTHRRLRLSDVLRYKAHQEAEAKRAAAMVDEFERLVLAGSFSAVRRR